MNIHPTALIDPGADLAPTVTIGPFCIIGKDVHIGANTIVASHAVIQPYTTIGADCHIGEGAVLGGIPQDFKFQGERSFLLIGDRNIIREYVTISRATGEDAASTMGNENMIMAYCHIGHNTDIGNNVTMANQVGISGFCVVEDRVVMGGQVGIHQFVRVGRLAMIGGVSKVASDVPPFCMTDGRPAHVVGLNSLGLRRAGIPPATRSALKQAYRLLYRSGHNLSQALETAYNEVDPSPERDYLLGFLSRIRSGFHGRQRDPGGPKKKK